MSRRVLLLGATPTYEWELADCDPTAIAKRVRDAIAGSTMTDVPVVVRGVDTQLVIDGEKVEAFAIVDMPTPLARVIAY